MATGTSQAPVPVALVEHRQQCQTNRPAELKIEGKDSMGKWAHSIPKDQQSWDMIMTVDVCQ